MKCPKCKGAVWVENKRYGTRFCLRCGFVPMIPEKSKKRKRKTL